MSIEANIRALQRVPMLAEMDREALRLLAFSAETIEVRPNEVLFEQGAPADGAYIVVRGRILLRVGADGPERVSGPGSLIGEMALLIANQRPCEAIASEPTQLLRIPRPLFRRMLDEFPAIAVSLQRRLAGRLQGGKAELDRVRATLNALDSHD